MARRKDEGGQEDILGSWTVTYKGGLASLPKPKIGKITLEVLPDRFRLTAGNNVAQKFWESLEIPYTAVTSVELADRNVSTFEALAGGLQSRQLNQRNNIWFEFAAAGGSVRLRVEMLTGVTVMGQAKKAAEFDDLLRSHQVRRRFGGAPAQAQPGAPASVADELAKLAAMRDQGILTDAEFQAQKARLLA